MKNVLLIVSVKIGLLDYSKKWRNIIWSVNKFNWSIKNSFCSVKKLVSKKTFMVNYQLVYGNGSFITDFSCQVRVRIDI